MCQWVLLRNFLFHLLVDKMKKKSISRQESAEWSLPTTKHCLTDEKERERTREGGKERKRGEERHFAYFLAYLRCSLLLILVK